MISKRLPVMLGMWVLGTMSLAFEAEEVEAISMHTIPPSLVQDEEVTLVLSGAWPDTCAATAYTLFRLGNLAIVNPFTRDNACEPEPTPWEIEASLGELSQGTYIVRVS